MQYNLYTEIRDTLMTLLKERMDAKGSDLPAQVASVRGSLPGKVRKQLEFLADVDQRMNNPKLAMKIDSAKVHSAYGTAREHLETIKPGKIAKRKRTGLIGALALNVFVVGMLLVVVLRWRGFI